MQNTAEKHADEAMPTSPEQLFAYLEGLEIQYDLHHHEAMFTVEQSQHLKEDIDGIHCRNLFLRDKKKNMYLVVARNETKIDLKKLDKLVGANRFSFGSADRLWQYLGVRSGSVCPYAIINDKDCMINVVLDKSMDTGNAGEKVNYHPLLNTMTISTTFGDLVKFIKSCGHDPEILDLTPAASDEGE